MIEREISFDEVNFEEFFQCDEHGKKIIFQRIRRDIKTGLIISLTCVWIIQKTTLFWNTQITCMNIKMSIMKFYFLKENAIVAGKYH